APDQARRVRPCCPGVSIRKSRDRAVDGAHCSSPPPEATHFDRCLPGRAYLVSVVAMPDDLPGLRASHEDRDRVVDALRVAGGDGRLTTAELDARLGRAR